MIKQGERIECFEDTLRISEGLELKRDTKRAIVNQRVYRGGFCSSGRNMFRSNNPAEIIIEENTSFAAARKYLKAGKTAVLNFANPIHPGGGVRNGAVAQEECLCRCSNLYAAISDQSVFPEYYGYHRNSQSHFFSDRLIYTPGITVFKTDDTLQLMEKRAWFQVDVITCAAPYFEDRSNIDERALLKLLKARIRNIFEVAKQNRIEVLILGAFGCGAFHNPPQVVAKAFYETIVENDYNHYFRTIVFAIKRSSDNDEEICQNIYAFEKVFGIGWRENNITFMTNERAKVGADTEISQSEVQQDHEQEKDALLLLEIVLEEYNRSKKKDKEVFLLIIFALLEAPIFFPVIDNGDSAFGDIDPASLKKGDILQLKEDLRMKFLSLETSDGDEYIPMFLWEEELLDRLQASSMKMYIWDYLPMLIQTGKPAVFHPFSNNSFVLTTDMMKYIWQGILQTEKGKKHIKSNPAIQTEWEDNVILGRYQIIKAIPDNVYFQRYVAEDNQYDRFILMTVWNKDRLGEKLIKCIKLREYERMQLHHIGIPQVYDVTDDEQHLYVVEEILDGMTLTSVLRCKGALSQQIVVKWALQVSEVLTYLHSMNPPRISGNIMPFKLFLTSDGNIKLMEDGVLYFSKETDEEDILEKESIYYAPVKRFGEQMDAQADIYALGVTMFELLTGWDLQNRPIEIQAMRKINNSVSKKLQNVILKCIKPNKNMRYQNCVELMAALQKV